MAQPEKASVPHWVGRYEVLVPIASGGMATVYLARSRGAAGFQREVALKLTHRHLKESPEFHAVLVEEAKLASSIRHHNVVAVLDVGDDPEGLFLVMEYVEGDTLSGLVRRATAAGDPLPRGIALRILLDALAGLHAAHETRDSSGKPLSIVHRDFSPHNILVGLDGVARLTDFGIAKASSRTGNTATGTIKGKAAYMAPEQARGSNIDRRCDVWAAGVVAWELLAARPLWERGAEDFSLLIKLVTEKPPRLASVAPEVSAELDEVVARALEIDVDKRWPTAAAFAKALHGAWEKSGALADAEQVAERVKEVVGAKLQKRREQVAVVEGLRVQLGDAAEKTMATPSAMASVPDILVPPAPPETREVPEDRTVIETRPPVEFASPAQEATHEAPSTDTNSSADAMAARPRKLPLARVALVVAAMATLGGVIGFIATRAGPAPSAAAATTSVSTGAQPTETQPTGAATPTTTPTMTAIPQKPVTAVAPAVVVTTSTVTSSASAHHVEPASHPPVRPTAPTSTRLAPSPY